MTKINNKERANLEAYIKKRFDDVDQDYKTFDTKAEIDSDLSYGENKGIIEQKLNAILPKTIPAKKKDTIIPKEKMEQVYIIETQRAEQQAKLEFEKVLEKIENDSTTNVLENIYYVPKQYAKMVAKGNARGMLLYGSCGIGKSYCVMRAFREVNVPFVLISGHITSLELYKFLFEHRKENIIFDDVNLLENKNNLNMLKSCLNDNSRIVSYHSSSSKLDVPSSFLFEGTIILLVNSKVNNEDLFYRGRPIHIVDIRHFSYGIHHLLELR